MNKIEFYISPKLIKKISDGKSHGLCCVYNEKSWKIYIDGVEYKEPLKKELEKTMNKEAHKKALKSCKSMSRDKTLNKLMTDVYKEKPMNKREKARETFKNLIESYKNILSEDFNNFESFLKDLFNTQNRSEVYKIIGYAFNKCVFPPESSKSIEIEINSNNNEPYFMINNTFVFIESKIDPENIYPKIKNAIVNSSKNFLPIMGLEIRNAFNNSSAIISKKLSSIDEYAFLHHQNNVNPKEAFFEFLKEIWRDQSFHFLFYDDNLKVFTELKSYKKERKITKEAIRRKIKKGDLDNDLGRLNCFYNLLVSTKKERCIGFGDIFSLEGDKTNKRYILCITARCDCLYPENLNNTFYFIEGTKHNITECLIEGDEGFNTFIEEDNNERIVCIKWKDKPITIYIPNISNNITSDIPINIGANNYTANYKATLKENYAQRMANKAFSYPFHVGIFFADKKKKKN